MLIRYFRSNFPGQFVTAGAAGLLLWGAAVMHPPVMPPPDGPVPLYALLYQWLSCYPYLAMAAGFTLVVFQAVWLNFILLKHNLVPPNTALAALLFLIFTGLSPSWLTLTPVNITTLFLLLILRALLEAYNQSEPIELIYTMGFFTGLSSFFYLPSLFIYGFLLVSFLVYRLFRWREWVSSLIGLATPLLYLLIIYFMTDRLPELASLYIAFFMKAGLAVPLLPWHDYIPYCLAGLLGLSGLWDTFGRLREKRVETRKKNLLLIWLMMWLILILPYSHSLLPYHTGLLGISLTAFTANFYLNLKKPRRFEFLLWLIMLAILANTLIPPIIHI